MTPNQNSTPNQTPTFERTLLDDYLKLDYPITLYPDSEAGGYVAEIRDLPGCLTQGESLEEVIKNINEALQLWIEHDYESGRTIPLPTLMANSAKH